MGIKNKLTVTRGEEEGDNKGKKEKGHVKEHVLKTHGQGQWGGDYLWEQVLHRVGGEEWGQL